MTPAQFSHRAGRYVQQPGGYRAFQPASLPPEPPDDVDEVFNYVGAMNHGLARLGDLPLSARPIATEVQELTGTSYPAANNLVRQFVTQGILHEMTGQKRHRRFIYRDYIDLFHDAVQEPGSP